MDTILVERRPETPRPGRPPIGPKVQTAAPEDCYAIMEQEAERRGVRLSIVVREVLIAGCEARYGGAS